MTNGLPFKVVRPNGTARSHLCQAFLEIACPNQLLSQHAPFARVYVQSLDLRFALPRLQDA
jgi:hypothetical protein